MTDERGSVKLCGWGCVGHTTDEHAPVPVDGQLREQIEDAARRAFGLSQNPGPAAQMIDPFGAMADAILPVVSAAIAEAKAEALEEAAADYAPTRNHAANVKRWLLNRAAKYRTPKETHDGN